MIYSNYNAMNESVNYFEDFKIGCSGINIPNTTSVKEQSMFLEGLAESTMIGLFEKLGAKEYSVFESATDYVNEGFEAVGDFFKKILDSIGQFFQKIIQWITDKVNAAKRYFREKDVEKKLAQIAKLKGKEVDSSKVVAKVSINFFRTNEAIAAVAANRAAKAKTLANSAFAGEYAESDVTTFKLDMAKKMCSGGAAGSMGSGADTLDGVYKGYKEHFVGKEKKDVTFGEAISSLNNVKQIVLAGSQKAVVKKAYQAEKKAINDMLGEFKKHMDKKSDADKSVVARVKDVIMVMDRFCKIDMEVVQTNYMESYAILNGLAKVGRASKDAATYSEIKNESVNFSEFDW